MNVIKAIDTIYLTASLFPNLKNYDLNNICNKLDIKTDDQTRHSALGDCIITARLFIYLLNIAKDNGVKNILELISLCEKGKTLLNITSNSNNIN